MKKIIALFRSRRFGAVVSAALLLVFNEQLGLSMECAQTIVAVISAWIVGDSINKTE